jgi:hypothetical protein
MEYSFSRRFMTDKGSQDHKMALISYLLTAVTVVLQILNVGLIPGLAGQVVVYVGLLTSIARKIIELKSTPLEVS